MVLFSPYEYRRRHRTDEDKNPCYIQHIKPIKRMKRIKLVSQPRMTRLARRWQLPFCEVNPCEY